MSQHRNVDDAIKREFGTPAYAGAFDAMVRTNDPPEVAQAAREQRADDLSAAVDVVRSKYENEPNRKRKAALKAALAAAEAEAEQARAEALGGSE